MILPDILDYNLNIIFCGTAASKKSKKLRAYYAGPGNKFWKILHEIGLTETQLKPRQFKKLIDYGIGLTDICKTDFGNDDELDKSKYDINNFNLKILEYQPKIVCFNGKNAAKAYLNQKTIDYGHQEKTINTTKIFVAPSTSGSANGFWNKKIWEEILNFI